uniref:Uncharacterized protein n=1 Tax=Mesocestoides corti TaxID=53468 RepID=A0A5K3G182_MESCO
MNASSRRFDLDTPQPPFGLPRCQAGKVNTACVCAHGGSTPQRPTTRDLADSWGCGAMVVSAHAGTHTRMLARARIEPSERWFDEEAMDQWGLRGGDHEMGPSTTVTIS